MPQSLLYTASSPSISRQPSMNENQMPTSALALASIELMIQRAERDLGIDLKSALDRVNDEDGCRGFADAVAAHVGDFLQYMVMR